MNQINDIPSAGAQSILCNDIINDTISAPVFFNMELSELGQKFKECRQEAGLTQQQVADELEMSLRAVQYFEKGEKEWSLIKTLKAFKLVGYKMLLCKDVEELV